LEGDPVAAERTSDRDLATLHGLAPGALAQQRNSRRHRKALKQMGMWLGFWLTKADVGRRNELFLAWLFPSNRIPLPEGVEGNSER